MKYDLLVFIGRFQPLHLGHQEVIERARSLAKRVLVLVGSQGVARSARNPFSYDERRNMIKRLYPDVIVRGVNDHTYNDTAWVLEVQNIVNEVQDKDQYLLDASVGNKIGLIGCEKDHSSFYLKLFPEWGNENVAFANPLNATGIRKEIYDDVVQSHEMMGVMAKETARWIFNEYKHSLHFERAKGEHEYLKTYKDKYGPGPFLTADALVQVAGNILLITRGKEYGQGLLAMPGGFANLDETLLNAAIRELKEETRLKVPVPVLKGSIVNSVLADDPHRSARGRIVSYVQHIRLTNETSLPEVRGSDDADKAEWVPISSLREQDFFEDHFHVIKKLLGI